MYLVVGLAIAALAGILAAFYFSVRSGKRGGNRLRSAGKGRPGADRAAAGRGGAVRRPASRAGGPSRTGQTEFALRASGPARAAGRSRQGAARPSTLTESWPAAPSDLEDPEPGEAWPADSAATDPGLRAAEAGGARPDASAPRDARPRRRVGFRKGADIDEELWPAETFGGVSDEQFWDDLASDKPLTTTARTAQAEPGPRNRLPGTGSVTDGQGTQALGGDRGRRGRAHGDRDITSQGTASRNTASRNTADRNTADRNSASREAAPGRRGTGSGAYPGPRTGPDPAAERTMVQPAYAATQPAKSMTAPVLSAPPPLRQDATQPARSATPPPTPPPTPPQPARAAAGTSPGGSAGQPRGTSASPGETGRRRRPSGAEEDPLTSAAFSLRQRGPVDGRSSLRSRDQDDAAAGSGRDPASPYGHTTPYPPSGTSSYDDASSATQMMSTPPSGENYGYGGASPADQPRRQNGARSHARPGGSGEQAGPARPAYSQDIRPANGSYPSGAYPGNGYHGQGYQPGGYQGNGHPGSAYPGSGARGGGHRAPHDPRDDYRRLTHPH